ncbi:hypothetical protein BB561_002644 [Smittium simulii]|uniref:CAP-Gly domain-containing protein n=1 Tax=Smittium simulii TaxID=133385 RepID=A0A2T9YPP4_9FUNG|nr:hypothetical protein BB561_002644 [Smittium simulii]
MDYYIGQRVRILSKGTGTIRYTGFLPKKEGQWLGIEWDDPTQGKHSGTFENKKYFEVNRIENSASFINTNSKIIVGVSILQAAKNRYYSHNADLPKTIGVFAEVKAVGFDKIVKNYSNLQNISVMSFNDDIISGIMNENVEDIKLNFCSLTTLDLSNNLIPSWEIVQRMVTCFPKIDSLRLDRNKMDFSPTKYFDFKSCINIPMSSLTNLNLSRTDITWDNVAFF